MSKRIALRLAIFAAVSSSSLHASTISITTQSRPNPIGAAGPWAVTGNLTESYTFSYIVIRMVHASNMTVYTTPNPPGITAISGPPAWQSGNLPIQPAAGNPYSIYADLYSYTYLSGTFFDVTSAPRIVRF